MEECKILGSIVTFADHNDLKSLFRSDLKKRDFIIVTNAHNQYLALKDPFHRKIHKDSFMNLSDSNMLKYSARFLGTRISKKVLFGSELVKNICKFSMEQNLKIGFYGSDSITLKKMISALKKEFKDINISFSESPPFRELTINEEQDYINQINKKNIDVLFVGLGCPKQEKWMHKNSKKINSLMLGVGAAFEYIANDDQSITKYHAFGLGWLYRLIVDPKRLLKRYFIDGSKFFICLIKQKITNV